jgi:predicted MFS family arabinose efflux permease
MSEMLRPLSLRPFRRLLFAYSVNAVGTWLGEIALAVLVLRATRSPAAVGAVWVVWQLAPAPLVPALVARLERLPAERSLPALLAVEAALFALLAAFAAELSLSLVLVVAAVDGLVGTTARSLTKTSVVTVTAPAGLLREANALLVGAFTVCMALGPFLGGAIVGLASPQWALAADAASFGFAALALGVGARLGRPHPAQGSERDQRLADRLREGLAYVHGKLALRKLLFAYAVVGLLSAAIIPIEIVLVTDTLGASESAYGTVLALWGLGSVVGGALLGRIRNAPLWPLVAAAYLVVAVSYFGMGVAGSVALVCVFSFVGGTANGIEAFAVLTAIQEATDEAHQARINGLFEALAAACAGIGFLLGGLIAAAASARAVYIAAAVGIAIATLLLTVPIRKRRSLSDRPLQLL